MGVKRPLVQVKVEEVEGVALVAIRNNRGRPVHFTLKGVVGEDRFVVVGGNDTYRSSFDLEEGLTIHMEGSSGGIVYTSPTLEV